MCQGCGDDYFESHERPELTAAMAELAGEIAVADRDYALTYSGLHIVIGDWNLETSHIEYCQTQRDVPLTEQQQSIANRLRALTEAERYVVMDRAEDRWRELYGASSR